MTELREIHEKLKALRLRSGLSIRDIAKGMGYAGPASYLRYEDPDRFTDDLMTDISELSGLKELGFSEPERPGETKKTLPVKFYDWQITGQKGQFSSVKHS